MVNFRASFFGEREKRPSGKCVWENERVKLKKIVGFCYTNLLSPLSNQ